MEQLFQDFFEGWLIRKQNLLDQLLSSLAMPDSESKMDHQNRLIEQVLSQYQQYIEEKAKVAEALNVLSKLEEMKVEEEYFQHFFEEWLLRKQNFLDQLLSVLAMPDSGNKMEHQNRLIDQVLSHYQQYIEEKAKVAEADVSLLLSSTWLSGYERALLWIGDYKPSLILRLANDAVEGLSVRQREMLEKMMGETRGAEREIGGEMATVQESVASPQILGLARKVGRVLDGEIFQPDSAVEGIKTALVGVLKKADELRVSTVRKAVGILTPPQTVQFLAAVTEFQLRVRRLGLQRDQAVPSC